MNIGLLATKGRAPVAEVHAKKEVSPAQPVVEHPKSSTPPQETRLSTAAVAIFRSNDTESLRDLLRDSGLPEEMVRDFVKLKIMKKYEKQMIAFTTAQAPAQDKQAWWKDDQNANGNKFSLLKQEQEEADRLGREASEESKRLIGVDVEDNQYQIQELPFLTPEKIRALRNIEQDYGEIFSKLVQDTTGLGHESAREEIRFIEAEKKRDLDSLLSPSELEAFEMRQSPTAQKLRELMTQLDATESEYMKIFPLQKAFDEKYEYLDQQLLIGGSGPDPKILGEREAAQARLEEKIKFIVGEKRYKESFLKHK